ncbi:MAG: 4Fe-4S double cluster binding domain-containing protein [Dehalococcoidia bacterium]|nr:4Fe-4S double cluster binding domain-containing protein [Dehalococcoidia bacterium]
MSKPAAANSQAVKEFAREHDVDIVGVTSVEMLEKVWTRKKAGSVLPGAKSVIVFGIMMPAGAVESPSDRVTTAHGHTMYEELARISYQVSRFMERAGSRSAAVPTHIPIEMSRETKGLVGEISFKHAAMAAGLGVGGKSCLLLTPQWGPRIRLGAVVTEAALEPDPMLQEDYCGNCRLCIEACPTGAIQPDRKIDSVKCVLHLNKYGLPQFRQFLGELLSKPPEEQQKAMRDPYFWSLYQSITVGFNYGCTRCLEVCPVGR